MGLLDDMHLYFHDVFTSMQDNIMMVLLDIKNEILSKFISWSFNIGSVVCDIICVGILVYACVVAFKIMSDGVFSEDKPSKLVDQTMYLSIGYFIARVFSNILPLLR